MWALATGVAVIVLARERYGFVPWVVGFLALTWLTTLFFSRSAAGGEGDPAPSLRHELISYVTRVLYQETLFFLIPFYAYSTVFPSWSMVFLALLGLMAVLSCLDLVFDRWIRASPVFGLVFFALVAFAGLNLLLPLLLGLAPAWATPVAGGLAVASSIPLVARSGLVSVSSGIRLAASAAAILAVALFLRPLVPPVPLRLEEARFGAGFDESQMQLVDPLAPGGGAPDQLSKLVVLARVFAPASVPSRVVVEWHRDGEPIRTSREVQITAHEAGFRVWDTYRPETGAVPPGRYTITLRTAEGGQFGGASVRLP